MNPSWQDMQTGLSPFPMRECDDRRIRETQGRRTDQTADDIIADCDGDPRAAVIELLAIIRSLIHESAA